MSAQTHLPREATPHVAAATDHPVNVTWLRVNLGYAIAAAEEGQVTRVRAAGRDTTVVLAPETMLRPEPTSLTELRAEVRRLSEDLAHTEVALHNAEMSVLAIDRERSTAEQERDKAIAERDKANAERDKARVNPPRTPKAPTRERTPRPLVSAEKVSRDLEQVSADPMSALRILRAVRTMLTNAPDAAFTHRWAKRSAPIAHSGWERFFVVVVRAEYMRRGLTPPPWAREQDLETAGWFQPLAPLRRIAPEDAAPALWAHRIKVPAGQWPYPH